VTWEPSRIPLVCAPLPGEALDSYIAAYARRLKATTAELFGHVGLPGARAARMVVRLTGPEAQALARACGLTREELRAMTLEPHDGLAVAIAKGRRRVIRGPAWRFSGSRTRFCPLCLGREAGRGPLSWRFPWSFACAEHRVLLVDFCPRCGRYPDLWSVRFLGPAAAGVCSRGHPGAGPCGADLAQVTATVLPAGGVVLGAHRHLAELLAADADGRAAALAQLRTLYALAWRALRGLGAGLEDAPEAVHAVLAECGGRIPKTTPADVGDDALNAAVGTAVAVIAHVPGHAGREEVFDWLLRVDRALMASGSGPAAEIGLQAMRWRLAGEETVGRVLRRLDGRADLHARMRYATATGAPCWPRRTSEQIGARAAGMPAMLWPSWTMRLLPRPGAVGQEIDPRTALFRRGAAAFMLLTGGPARLNFERVVPLLGPGRRASKPAVDRLREAVERRIYAARDLTPLARTLAELAHSLDEQPGPIDYARRRAMFTEHAVHLDPKAYERVCLQLAWYATPGRAAVLTWYLRALLTGEMPSAGPGGGAFTYACNQMRYDAPAAVRDFLHREAGRHLAEHGIEEPVVWEPEAERVSGAAWPGVDPDRVDAAGFAAVLGGAEIAQAAAETLGWTCEHVRLYCEITRSGPPSKSANGLPLAPDRVRMLSAETLQGLYESREHTLRQIAALAGSSPVTVKRLLEIDGVALRGHFEHVQPPEGIDREWFEYEHFQRRRSVVELARECAVSTSHLRWLAVSVWGLEPRSTPHASGIGHLNLEFKPSEALHDIASGRTALDRLAFLTELPGHQDLLRAADAIYGGRASGLYQRVVKLEKIAGFQIIDRSTTPLTATSRGASLLREAELVLRAADPSRQGPSSAPNDPSAGEWSRRVQQQRERNGSCPLECTDHFEHVYILCYGQPTVINDRDYLPGDPARDYPVTHYVGWTGQPPGKRIAGHGSRAVRFLAQVRPGTTAAESQTKLRGRCPVCDAGLWYFAESPTYPGWTAEEIPQVFEWPRRYFQSLRPRTRTPPRLAP